eukprot:15031-Heterococcus_DN1.PRE.1
MASASASPLPPVPLGLVLHAWACLSISDLLRIRAVSKSWRASQANNDAQLRELRRLFGSLQPYAFLINEQQLALIPACKPNAAAPIFGPFKAEVALSWPALASNAERSKVVILSHRSDGCGAHNCCHRVATSSMYDVSLTVCPPAFDTLPAIPEHRNNMALTWTDSDELIVTGGALSRDDFVDTVYSFSVAQQTWRKCASMHTARANHCALWLPTVHRVLVMGGRRETSCELYDPATDTWHEAASMARARWGFAAGMLPGITDTVLVAGGYATAVDEATSTWSTAECEVRRTLQCLSGSSLSVLRSNCFVSCVR